MDDTFGGVIIQSTEPQVLVEINHGGGNGRSGFSGFSGAAGSGEGGSGGSSFSGFSGYSGQAGPEGASGFSGAPSPGGSGFSGFSGKSGFSGPTGGAGASGQSGYSGGVGGTGTSGFSGFVGGSGFSGFSSTVEGKSGFSGFSAASPGPSGFSGFSGGLGGASQPYVFDTNTTGSDPGSGKLRFNAAFSSSVTSVYADDLNGNATNVATWWMAINNYGSPTSRGILTFYRNANTATSSTFNVTGSVVDSSGYRTITVQFISSTIPGVFADTDPITVFFTPTGQSGFSGSSGFSGGPGPTGTSGFSGAGASGFSGYSGSGFSGFSGRSGYSAFSGFSGTGQSGFSGFSGTFAGLVTYSMLDRTTTVVAETATLTIAANTKIKSTATGTLTTIVFSSGADPAQARSLDLDVTGGPYTITIPACRRLGETASITSLSVETGYQEFSWEFIGGEYVMSDSVSTGGGAGNSGYSGYSAVGSSGFSGRSGFSGPQGISGFSGAAGSGGAGSNLLTSLYAYYKMDEASGSAIDASGAGLNLTESGGTVAVGSGIINGGRVIAGGSGGAPYFGYFSDNTKFVPGANQFFVTAWVKSAVTTYGYDAGVLGKYVIPNSEYLLYRTSDGNGTHPKAWAFQVSSTGSGGPVANGPQQTDTNWHFLAAGWDGTDVKLSVDGGTFTTTAFAGPVWSTSPTAFQVGVEGASNAWNGTIDEVGIWIGRCLTQTEVSILYNSGVGLPYDSFANAGGGGGASGFSGFSGKSGFSGFSATGTSGFSGFSAASPGASGFSGFSGRSGYSGFSGSGFSGFSGPQLLTFSTQTDTDYTLALGDANTGIKMVSSAAHIITIPANASVAFPIGTQIVIEQGGTAVVSIITSGSAILQGASATTGQYSSIALIKQATDTWYAAGAGQSGYSGVSGYSGTTVLYANATGQSLTSTTLVDITGLTFPLVAGTYIFDAEVFGNCATGTTGCQLGINYTGTYTSGSYHASGLASGTTVAQGVTGTANNTPTGTFLTTSGAEGWVRICGQIITGGSGTFSIRALKVTNQTFNVKAGGRCWVNKVA